MGMAHIPSVGHISENKESVNDCITNYFFNAQLISIEPVKQGDDGVITKTQIKTLLKTILKL